MTNQYLAVNNSNPEDLCQQSGYLAHSHFWRPYPVVMVRALASYLRREGLASTVRKIRGLVFTQAPNKTHQKAARPLPVETCEVLDLQPGDWVQVKSEEEILATLDSSGKHRGMAFLPKEMLANCGKHYRVHKRVEKIYLEESRQNRKVKNTVLLEGVLCQGIGVDCDRSCFLFWREVWLKRIDCPTKGIL